MESRHLLEEPLFFIQWHLINGCNLKCSHCYQNRYDDVEINYKRNTDLAKRVIEDFVPIYGGVEFNLTGGEPLLYADLLNLARVITDAGAQWNLLSNGTLLNAESIEELRQAGIKSVQISIEGIGLENDKVRGAGSFEKAIAAIRLLREANIPTNLAVTLTSNNIGLVDELVNFASNMDVGLGFHRYIPMGKNGYVNKDIQPSSEEWDCVLTKLANAKLYDGRRVTMNDPLFGLKLFQMHKGALGATTYKGTRLFGCTMGLNGVTVMPNGDVYPCRKLPISLGNVYETDLIRIWLDSELLWTMRNRSQLGNSCGKCASANICGGCRASAYWNSQNLNPLSEDGFCLNCIS